MAAYLRRNYLGLIAIFLALNGAAYAAVSRGSVDSGSIRNRSIQGVDIQSAAIHARHLDLASVSQVLQARITGVCRSGRALRVITRLGSVSCSAVMQRRVTGRCKEGEAIRWINGKGGVSCTATTDPITAQRRITGTCTSGAAIAAIGADGSVVCEPPVSAVSAVSAGTGLSGGGGPGAVSLSADTEYLQRRVASCGAGAAIQTVQADGTVSCLTPTTGTVTSVGVTAGSGLTASPNPITSTGSLGTDFGTIQKRVTGSCAGNTAVQSVGSGGTASCSQEFTPATKVLTSGVLSQSHEGANLTLLNTGTFEVIGRCPKEGAQLIIEAVGGMNVASETHLEGFHTAAVESLTVNTVPEETTDKGSFEIGGYAGSAAGHTLSGSFYDFSVGGGCQFVVTAIYG